MHDLRLRIKTLDEDGRGVGEAGGLEVHVTGALPGEMVSASVEHVSPHAPRAWASLRAIDGPAAEERVEPACPGHGRCGGCMLQHLAYPAQLTFKRRAVEAALGRAVDDVVASPHEIHYRNKAKYVIFATHPGLRPGAQARDGGLLLGSYAPASHRVVDMAGCQVPEPPIDGVARATLSLAEKANLSAYDERQRTGELRHLVVRANAGGDVLVVIVARSAIPLARLARDLRRAHPRVAGVVLNVNPDPGGAIFGRRDVILDGAGALADQVGGARLELSARAFFQVNRAQAARIYAEVARLAGARPGLRAVDLYCGVGGIALTLAARGARVTGVEAAPEAISDARRSAAAAGLAGRAQFRAGDAADSRDLQGADVLVVNPPRKGLAPDVRAAIAAAAPPRIIYVSCSPRSLAADLAALADYQVDSVRPFDLMPGTPHVETVVGLSRKRSG